MPDTIDELCKRYKLTVMMENKKDEIAEVLRLLLRAYEVFYGKDSSLPVDIAKDFIRNMVELSPEALHLRCDLPKDIADRLVSRVVEKFYEIARRSLVGRNEVTYVS